MINNLWWIQRCVGVQSEALVGGLIPLRSTQYVCPENIFSQGVPINLFVPATMITTIESRADTWTMRLRMRSGKRVYFPRASRKNLEIKERSGIRKTTDGHNRWESVYRNRLRLLQEIITCAFFFFFFCILCSILVCFCCYRSVLLPIHEVGTPTKTYNVENMYYCCCTCSKGVISGFGSYFGPRDVGHTYSRILTFEWPIWSGGSDRANI